VNPKTVDDPISIKGIREGLLVTIKPDSGEWAETTARLTTRIDEKKNFFRGARVALDVGDRPVRPHELDNLKAILTRREMTLWAVVSSSPTTQQAARNLGLETALTTGSDQLESPALNSEERGEYGVVIMNTLRSGRTVTSPGHVTVFGDVNPGAEIVAVGSVIVWGKLRGIVHAGSNGDESAVVAALDLAPTQLRIASFITVSPNDKRRKPQPEVATVQNGRIVAEAWKS
jgi:septum site-determining protein MinC